MCKVQIGNMFINITVLLVLCICSAIDIKKKEVPLIILLIGFSAALGINIWQICKGELFILEMAVSVMPGVFFLLLSFCTGEKIGYGDGLLIVFLGLSLGFGRCSLIICIGLIASSVFALILIVFCKAGRNSRLPLVPFLAIGMGVSFFV